MTILGYVKQERYGKERIDKARYGGARNGRRSKSGKGEALLAALVIGSAGMEIAGY